MKKLFANFSAQGRGQAGFTLVELLCVMGIIAILSAVAVPAISAISAAGNVNATTGDMAQLLGAARTYAMGHNTYVWVGFAPNTASQTISVGMVAGNTGSATDITSSAYSPITPVQTFPHFNLTTVSTVQNSNSKLTGMWDGGSELTDTQAGTWAFSLPTGATPYQYVLEFTPQGEANLPPAAGAPASLPHWIQFGLQPALGKNNQNVAAIQVAGLSGGVQVFRP